jgi:hypothetical protein
LFVFDGHNFLMYTFLMEVRVWAMAGEPFGC